MTKEELDTLKQGDEVIFVGPRHYIYLTASSKEITESLFFVCRRGPVIYLASSSALAKSYIYMRRLPYELTSLEYVYLPRTLCESFKL